MDLTHIRAFTAAMERKDLDTMLTHMADDVTLRTPLAAEPLEGKLALRPVVQALLNVVDAFDFREVMEGPEHVSSFFRVTVGPDCLDGMDYWRLNDAGLIQEMTVLWRPFRPSRPSWTGWRALAEGRPRHAGPTPLHGPSRPKMGALLQTAPDGQDRVY